MMRKQLRKLLTFVLLCVMLTGSFGAAASAAEADAVVSGESFDVLGRNEGAEDASEIGADAGQQGDSATEADAEQQTGAGQQTGACQQAEDVTEANAATDENAGQQGDASTDAASGQQGDAATDADADQQGDTATESASGQQGDSSTDADAVQQGDATTETDAGQQGDAATESDAGQQADAATDADATLPEIGTELTAPAAVEVPGTAALNSVSESVTTLKAPGKPDWKNTTMLTWDAVDHAERYRVTVYLKKGTQKYYKVVYVYGRTSVELEDEIVSLIRTNRKNIAGAAYSIYATVQAQNSDTGHYKNSGLVAAPTFRYLRTTYLEALERNGWYTRNGNWYYYEDGVMRTGWVSFGGERYYLNKDGVMLKSRWYSGKYLKSDGAMAKNEWVENYKYYVDASGSIVEGTAVGMKNWVQTKAGWRYKKPNGSYVKNTWYSIGHRMYYFDEAGHMVTGWLKQDGNTYYLKNSGEIKTGRGARQSGWLQIGSSSYWFDKNGVMAKSQWVDKGQYYVNAAGRKQSWISYAALRNVNTSNRLGYDVYSYATPPEQSIAGYDLAYKNGNRILVVDLRFTKDGVPVCFHDDTISYARLTNGKEPAKKPTISTMTYQELCKFDYGIYKGAKYKETAPLTLAMMAAWIRRHSDAELYIEVKADKMNATQMKNLSTVLETNGVTNQCSTIFTVTSANDTRAKRLHNLLPSMRIGITTSQIGTLTYTQLDQVKGNNETFVWAWDTVTLSAHIVSTLKNKNVPYECGIFKDDLDSIISYYSKGSPHVYNSGVETPGAVFKALLSAATFHDKAQWVSTDKGWKYQKVDKTFVKNSWLTLAGKKYYLNANGIMQTGWLNLSGKMYYLESDGAMVKGWKYVGDKRYYFGADGVMLTGTQTLNGHVYQFDSKGVYVKKIK